MSNEIAQRKDAAAEIVERVMLAGDLTRLEPEDRVRFYQEVCSSVGLNPLTQPFEYITLNGKLTLYAKKSCTDQLRAIHGVTITIASRETREGVYIVSARATNAANRGDEDIGAVTIANLKGDALCNAMMKAETKAKRRVTLSICGLGMLDETEIETIPGAKPAEPMKVELTAPQNMPPATQQAEPRPEVTEELNRFPDEMEAAFKTRGFDAPDIAHAINGIQYEATQAWEKNPRGKPKPNVMACGPEARKVILERIGKGHYDRYKRTPQQRTDDEQESQGQAA